MIGNENAPPAPPASAGVKSTNNLLDIRKTHAAALREQRRREKEEARERHKAKREREMQELSQRQELSSRVRMAMLARKKKEKEEAIRKQAEEATANAKARATAAAAAAEAQRQARETENAKKARKRADELAAAKRKKEAEIDEANFARKTKEKERQDKLKREKDEARRKRESLAFRANESRRHAAFARTSQLAKIAEASEAAQKRRMEAKDVQKYEAYLREARRQSLQYRGAEHVRHAALDKAAAVEKLAEQSSFIDDRAAGFEAKKNYIVALAAEEKENLQRLASEHAAAVKYNVEKAKVQRAESTEHFREHRMYSEAVFAAKNAAKNAADEYLSWKKAQVERERLLYEVEAKEKTKQKEKEKEYKLLNVEDDNLEKKKAKDLAKMEFQAAARKAAVSRLHSEFEARKIFEVATQLRKDQALDRASVFSQRAKDVQEERRDLQIRWAEARRDREYDELRKIEIIEGRAESRRCAIMDKEAVDDAKKSEEHRKRKLSLLHLARLAE